MRNQREFISTRYINMRWGETLSQSGTNVGMLVCSSKDGSGVMHLPVECKAPCPFHDNTGPSESTPWKYEPQFCAWSRVPPPYYVQCQMTMLATGCSQMLLMQYLPQTTTIYLVQRDDVLARQMLVHLASIHLIVLRRNDAASMGKLFGMPAQAKVFQDLLRFAREGAAGVTVLAKVDSYNNSVDSQPFLD
jgi:hypothetical protein